MKKHQTALEIRACTATSELQVALSDVTNRLSAIDDLQQKLTTLGRLCEILPAPIAAVLASVMADIQRLAAIDTGPVPF